MGSVAAAHSWAWGQEGRLVCPGSLGGALGMGGDSQSASYIRQSPSYPVIQKAVSAGDVSAFCLGARG